MIADHGGHVDDHEWEFRGFRHCDFVDPEGNINQLRAAAYTCPACGYPDLDEPPRTSTGGGSYEICRSCGFEFGVTDEDLGFSYDEWRQQWIDLAMPWSSSGVADPPDGWDPGRQLRKAGH